MSRNGSGHTFWVDHDLWDEFDGAVRAIQAQHPELAKGRSMVIRELIKNWLGSEHVSGVQPNKETHVEEV